MHFALNQRRFYVYISIVELGSKFDAKVIED